MCRHCFWKHPWTWVGFCRIFQYDILVQWWGRIYPSSVVLSSAFTCSICASLWLSGLKQCVCGCKQSLVGCAVFVGFKNLKVYFQLQSVTISLILNWSYLYMPVRVIPFSSCLLTSLMIVIWTRPSSSVWKSQAATSYEPRNGRLLFLCLTASPGLW